MPGVGIANDAGSSVPERRQRRPTFLSAVGWSVIAGLVTTVFGLLASVLIARSLGPALMGRYSYWLWLVGALPVFCGCGLPQAALKFSAELRGRGQVELAASVVRALLKVELCVAGLLAFGLLAVGQQAEGGGQFPLYAMVAALVVLGGADEILTSAIKGAMDYRFSTLRALPLSAIQLGLLLAVLRADGGVAGLLLVMVACGAGAIGFTVWRSSRLYRFDSRRPIPGDLRRAIVTYCRSVTSLGLLDAVVWSRSEVFFLGLLARPEDIAFYSLAYGVAGRLVMAATLVTHPMVPAMSALHAAGDIERMNRMYRGAVRYVALLTFPLALGGIVFARPLIELLYTGRYLDAAPALAVIAASGLAGSITLACSASLYAIGRPDFLVRLNVPLAVADVALAVVLIPPLGATGAAVANAIGPTVTVVAATVFLERRHHLRFPVGPTLRILVAAAGAVALTWLLVPVQGAASFLAAVLVGAGAYLVAALVARAVSRDEDGEILERIGRRLPLGLRSRYHRILAALP